MKIKRVTLSQFKALPGLDKLVREYSLAFDENPTGSVKVAWEAYEAFGDNLRIVVALYQGSVVGVAACLIQRSRHYDGVVVSMEALYLMKDYRKGSAGIRLLKEVGKIAKEQGAKGFALCAPPESTLERFCLLNGYVDLRHVYWVPV